MDLILAIVAFSSGVPVAPMAYSRKFAGLFGTLGYERTIECRSDKTETILAAPRSRRKARWRLTGFQERLNGYVDFLTELLREIAEAK